MMNPATNQTTIEQGRRLLAAGCPFVKLHMQPAAHKIVPDPIPLGREGFHAREALCEQYRKIFE